MVGACLFTFTTWHLFPFVPQNVKTFLAFKSFKITKEKYYSLYYFQFLLLDDL